MDDALRLIADRANHAIWLVPESVPVWRSVAVVARAKAKLIFAEVG